MNDRLIFFNDGCLAAMIIIRNESKKWELMGVSEVLGMGNAEYKNHIFNDDFDEIIGFSSFSGKAFAGLKRAEKWGLLEIIDNGTTKGSWELVEDFDADTIDEVLAKRNVVKEEYQIS